MSNVDKFYELINELGLDGEAVANLLTNFHGNQLITDDFMEFLEDEGYIL